MSRIGSKPVIIPKNIECKYLEGDKYLFKSSKGENQVTLARVKHEYVNKDDVSYIVLSPLNNSKQAREFWGLQRALLQNALVGVDKGFKKTLELVGTGYRALITGRYLTLYLGFSHDIFFLIPEGISVKVEKQTTIVIEGIDKYLVHQTAAKIRSFRPPEPYKGKGVKYSDEFIMRKEGKK